MRIKIGPYSSDLIPVRRWERSYEFFRSNTFYHDEKDWNKFDRLVYKVFDILDTLTLPVNRWSNNRTRKIEVHIDNYDVWSMEHTLALVIVPMLKKLRDQKHGAPHVDPEDGPTELSDEEFLHERWDWVLDEMIWSFEQHASDNDDDQFHYNLDNLGFEFLEVDGSSYKQMSITVKDPTKPAHFYDREAHQKHDERKANGRRLFAKYYDSLWD